MNKRTQARMGALARRASGAANTDAGVLFDRVASILEEARARVVRSVNSGMVLAYWHIGRELVEHLQGGGRADYGDQVAESLAERLSERFGHGFSLTNLKYFRLFYQAYPTRTPTIRHTSSDQLAPPTRLKESAACDDLDHAFEKAGNWLQIRSTRRATLPLVLFHR